MKIRRISKVGLALVLGLALGIYGATAITAIGQDDGNGHVDDSQVVVPQVETFDLSGCATQYKLASADEAESLNISEMPLAELTLVSISISRDPNGTCLAQAEFELND
mgnify:CR=1 FL=1